MKRSTEERGYGQAHRRERAKWQRRLDRGEVIACHALLCLEPDVPIVSGMRWDLGHTVDRTAWTGPEHVGCNRSEGATRGNLQREEREPSVYVPSLEW